MSEQAKRPAGMSVREAGQKGGETVKQKYGPEFYEQIGRKGGLATKLAHGHEFYEQIGKKGGKTEVHFQHVGLVPAYECYDNCSNAWGLLVNGNLRKLITTGQAQPSPW